jgi:serine/threonine protein kinase
LREKWGEKVVLKIPHDKEKEKILVNELIMNASLHFNLQMTKSKYVVPYLGHEEHNGLYVMVMKYIEGESLREYMGPINSQRLLTIDEALSIAEQVCEGLVEIHKFNIYHRDIKPENILIVKEDSRAMIMDLGISRFLSSVERASTTAGTIYYMPKELLGKEGGSFYSDIYSLGVTMYEMISGQLPFYGESIGEVIDNIRSQNPVPLVQLNPKVDALLSKIVLTAINREIKDRYAKAEDFLKAIKEYRQKNNIYRKHKNGDVLLTQMPAINNSFKETEENFGQQIRYDLRKPAELTGARRNQISKEKGKYLIGAALIFMVAITVLVWNFFSKKHPLFFLHTADRFAQNRTGEPISSNIAVGQKEEGDNLAKYGFEEARNLEEPARKKDDSVAAPESQIRALFEKFDSSLEEQDIGSFLSLIDRSNSALYNKQKADTEIMFSKFYYLKSKHTLNNIKINGDIAKVLCNWKLDGKLSGTDYLVPLVNDNYEIALKKVNNRWVIIESKRPR